MKLQPQSTIMVPKSRLELQQQLQPRQLHLLFIIVRYLQ